MFSVQSVLGFILGFAAAVFILILGAPLIWRRALFLAQKVVRTELPLSLKEIEADRDFLRARQAVIVCRLQEELAREKQEDHGRKLALSRAREQLQQTEALSARDQAQQAELARRDKQQAALEEKCRRLQDKAEQAVQLKKADLAQFRRQIQAIAAQTAGLIAAEEGENSAIWRLVAPAEAEHGGAAAAGARQKAPPGKNLAAAIYVRARQALAARRGQTADKAGQAAENGAIAPAPEVETAAPVIDAGFGHSGKTNMRETAARRRKKVTAADRDKTAGGAGASRAGKTKPPETG